MEEHLYFLMGIIVAKLDLNFMRDIALKIR